MAESAAILITGSTRLYAVLGDPVAQVKAPTLVNGMFRRLGHDAILVPIHVRPADLAATMAGLRRIRNLDGLLVTVPHKVAAVDFADRISTAVRITGSTNALRREPDGTWYAENFDGVGFVSGLREQGHDPAGRRVALIGAGGAGSAIAAAVLDAGAARLTLTDTDPLRRDGLLRRLSERWPRQVCCAPTAPLAETDIAINATPLGLDPGDPLPFAPQELGRGSIVADIIMQPRDTPLLRAAAKLGLHVHHGEHMLRHQLSEYRRFFGLQGVSADGEV